MFYVVSKYAIMRQKPEKGSPILAKVPFGTCVRSFARKLEGNVRVSYRECHRAGSFYTGYVSAKALSPHPVEDYGNLYYYNTTDIDLPCVHKYKSEKIIGYIKPGEHVTVRAKVGDWCVTSKGWTMFAGLSKDREIFDMAGINNLLYAILCQAAHDYCKYIKWLKTRRYKTLDEYCDICNELEKVIIWFKGRKRVMKSDYVTVRERMDDLNEKMGVDQKWIKRKLKARDYLYDGDFCKKKKDRKE